MQEPIEEGTYLAFREHSEALKQQLSATDQMLTSFFEARQGGGQNG
jgi:hypothetical protein